MARGEIHTCLDWGYIRYLHAEKRHGRWTNYFPIWGGEICSDDKAAKGAESDFHRMLFQAAGMVSFLNWIKYGLDNMPAGDPSFTIPLAYVDRDFTAQIYLLQEVNKTVCSSCHLL